MAPELEFEETGAKTPRLFGTAEDLVVVRHRQALSRDLIHAIAKLELAPGADGFLAFEAEHRKSEVATLRRSRGLARATQGKDREKRRGERSPH